MSRDLRSAAWEALVRRYADGRKICNCSQAYEDDKGMCENGCQWNVATLRYEIAGRALAEIEHREYG